MTKRLPIALVAAAAFLSGCSTMEATRRGSSDPAGGGLVSAADPRAVDAGTEILRQGGSAADAGIAVMLALTVVEPQSSGIGGGSFAVTSDRAGHVETYNGRETAPAAAGPQWFFSDGKPLAIDKAIPGGRSVGVPGNMRLAAALHRDQGKLAWAKLFAPAIRLARGGYKVTPRLHRALANPRNPGALTAEGRALYYHADGSAKDVGETVANPALAAALERFAAQGPDAFYVGPNAKKIVAAVNGASLNPSAMSEGDIAAYDAKEQPPVCSDYRGYRICGMGPPSSGATTVIQILKQLERFDLGAMGPRDPKAWHLIAESMRLAWADRNAYLGDPDFVRVPVAGLVDPAYLRQRSALIDPAASLATASPGTPPGAIARAAAPQQVEQGTSHFVVVDSAGRMLTQTSTIESIFGSGLIVDGYFLNNELTDFNLDPNDADGRPTANRVEGGKRPRSSMSPTIVFSPDGKPRLLVGAAGGATIIAQVAKAIIGVLDWKLSAQDAIALPVIFAPADTVFLEKGTFLEGMAPSLEALGHKVQPRDPSFKANAAEYVGGRWVGAADPRSEGSWATLAGARGAR